MTRDPGVQAAVDDETRRLAADIAAISAIADPHTWARDRIEAMVARGWRPLPRDPRIPTTGGQNPAAYERGATYARDLLNKRTEGGRP